MESIFEQLPRFFTYYNAIFMLKALAATFLLSAVSCIIGFCAGFFMAVTRVTKSWSLFPFRVATTAFVEFFRRVPPLVVLFLVFFAFNIFKIDIPIFSVALVGLCFISTAFIAEIVRAGFESVHQTQWDAAAAMNFGLGKTLLLVIIPQAWKVILPPVFIFFIGFIKDTALASQLGVMELTFAAKVFNDKGFAAFLCFGTVLVLYFMLSYPLTRIGAWTEARFETQLAPSQNS